jgi:hypothetical protein
MKRAAKRVCVYAVPYGRFGPGTCLSERGPGTRDCESVPGLLHRAL